MIPPVVELVDPVEVEHAEPEQHFRFVYPEASEAPTDAHAVFES